jgi:RhoGEF domain
MHATNNGSNAETKKRKHAKKKSRDELKSKHVERRKTNERLEQVIIDDEESETNRTLSSSSCESSDKELNPFGGSQSDESDSDNEHSSGQDDDDDEKVAKREARVRELVTSEQTHVDSLNRVVQEYLEPLRRAKPEILSASDISALFSNVEVVLVWNESFCKSLRAHISYDETFGDLFLDMLPLLRQAYSQYSENYEHAMATYERCKSRKQFAQWLESRQSALGDQRDLLSYLYLPIQRMIAYTSLLKGILALTPDAHADHAPLRAALGGVRAASDHGGDLAEQRKNADRVVQIHNSFADGSQIAMPHRRLVFEGDGALIVDGVAKERRFFLFNDIFLAAKPRRRAGTSTSKLETDFIEVLDTLRVEDVKHSIESRFQFRLVAAAHDYRLSVAHKHQWIALLARAIDDKRRSSLVDDKRRMDSHFFIQRIHEWAQSTDAEDVHRQIVELSVQLTHSNSNVGGGGGGGGGSNVASSSSSR